MRLLLRRDEAEDPEEEAGLEPEAEPVRESVLGWSVGDAEPLPDPSGGLGESLGLPPLPLDELGEPFLRGGVAERWGSAMERLATGKWSRAETGTSGCGTRWGEEGTELLGEVTILLLPTLLLQLPLSVEEWMWELVELGV